MLQRIIPLGAALLGLGPAGSAAAQGPWRYQYAAKIVCGTPDSSGASVVSQRYATAINVHNPSDSLQVELLKQLALTFPPGRQRGGKVIQVALDTLRPEQALVVACRDFVRTAGTSFEGFVVLLSALSLDVTAVYTVRGGIDVVEVRERVREAR